MQFHVCFQGLGYSDVFVVGISCIGVHCFVTLYTTVKPSNFLLLNQTGNLAQQCLIGSSILDLYVTIIQWSYQFGLIS